MSATPSPPADGSAAAATGVDVGAVLAAMQDQIDDLTATVEAQQRTIDELARDRRAGRPGGLDRAGTHRNGAGQR